MTNLVIFSPGMYAPTQSLSYLANQFEKQGYDTLCLGYHALGTDHPTKTSTKLAQRVSEAIHGHDHVTFIGHSLGGLIGRELVCSHEAKVDAYVSIATPHQGYRSFLKHMVAWNHAGMSMARGSEYLEHLSSLPWPETTKVLYVIATQDMVVEPAQQRVFLNASDEFVEIAAGHLGVIFSAQTFWEIWAWLSYTVGVGV